jgi:hypothetical protein
MKHRLVIAMASAVMLFSLLASIASAQANKRYKVDIPFNFIVTGHTLPAGSYILTKVDKNVIALGNDTDWTASLVIASRDESRAHPHALVFRRIGHKYFLAEAWFDWDTGVNIPKSAEEREALRAANSRSTNVTVATR